MPPDETTRVTLSLGAVAGGMVWGLYRLSTLLLANQPVHQRDVILALLNVAAAIIMGGLVAYFLGPVITQLIPSVALRDPHAVGFGIGAGAWEGWPLVQAGWRRFLAKKVDAQVGEGTP